MKRILKLLLPFLMAFALCLPVLAEEQRVFDNAGLLDEWEVSMLEDKIQDLRVTKSRLDILHEIHHLPVDNLVQM